MFAIRNLDKNTTLYFKAKTPYEAMTMLKYYLSVSDKKAKDLIIHKTESNRFLYLIYKGETYSVRM